MSNLHSPFGFTTDNNSFKDLSVNFTLSPWDAGAMPPAPQATHFASLETKGTLQDSIYLQHHPHQHTITAYQPLRDLNGRSSLCIQAEVPTTLLSQGRAAIRFSTLSIFMAGGLLLVSVYASLHWTLLGRLQRFSTHFHEITQKNGLSKRVSVSQNDEMSLLQSSFNHMLQHPERSDRALRENEETYRQIFNAVQDCLCVFDIKGRVIALNPSAIETFGYHPEFLAGQDIHQLVREEDQHWFNNFLKFTPDGAIRMKVYADDAPGNRTLHIEIHDNGPGIDSEAQTDIFDSFVQADVSATRTHGGMGTGLPVTKGLIGLLGGHIALQSEPGQGSTFTILLPLDSQASSLQRPA